MMGKEKEEVKKVAAVVEEAKKKVEEKKAERKDKDEDAEAEKSPPPLLLLQPPQAVTVAAAEEEVVVMRVFMDCVGCARKVRRALKGFEGVDEIKTDYKTQMVAVKGRGVAAEPTKMVERIYSKCGKKAELIIIPRPAPLPPLLLPPMASSSAPEKSKENNSKNKEEEKEEPQVVVAVLNIRMHCEACAQEIKKKILKVKGVHEADPNLVASQVTVKGVFNPATLAEYVHKRTRKHVTVAAVQVPPLPPLADAPLAAENRQNPNQEAEDGGAGGKKQKGKKQKDEENKNEKKSGGIEAEAAAAAEPTVVVVGPTAAAEASVEGEGGRQVTNEHRNANSYYNYYYQPHYPVDFYAYPPQIFSDENPNACVVM